MKKIVLFFCLSGLIFSLSNCNLEKTKEADPEKENWYVYKRKPNGPCTDPHYGEIVVGRNNYTIVCGPSTKKEAEKCYNKECND
jgi:hypothetical protein